MNFNTRKAALEAGESTYFTGKPCKHGHISYRYSNSGGCKICISGGNDYDNGPKTGKNHISTLESHLEFMKVQASAAEMVEQARLKMKAASVGQDHQALIKQGAARRVVKENMSLTKVRLFDAERAGLALVAFGLAVMRFPELAPGDVDPQSPSTHREPSGTAMHAFWCHPDDVSALRQAAADTFTRHPSDIMERRRQVLQTALELAEADSSPAPPLTFK
jgi:hypothetical protein